jgi:hypothetical protein
MALILPGIHSLEQHHRRLCVQPEDYRPERCPHCGKAGVWCHGAYSRKADREGRCDACLNPVPIPRFLCPHCQGTCSRLPQCLAPRRWYGWAVQQAVLAALVAGHSVRQGVGSSRRAAGRWRAGGPGYGAVCRYTPLRCVVDVRLWGVMQACARSGAPA